MTGSPWTRSRKVVHGPGPKKGSMDLWSMFCPHPEGKRPQSVGRELYTSIPDVLNPDFTIRIS